MKTVGFIGIGIMGQAMAKNLLKAGYDVQVYTRTKAKADAVVAAGAKWCDTIAACGDGAQAVITMVGFPKDVEEVYFGEEGILKSCAPGTYVIDMTTTSPRLSEKYLRRLKNRKFMPSMRLLPGAMAARGPVH